MWNRRRELESTAPEPHRFNTASPAPALQPDTPAPAERPVVNGKSQDTPAPALIGAELSIVGEVTTEQDLNIAGRVQGPVYCSNATVTVLHNGHVRGDVHAREVILSGTIEGDVVAKTRLVVRHDARLIGNVSCAAIMIEETAYFKGSIDIVRQRESQPATRNAAEEAAQGKSAGA